MSSPFDQEKAIAAWRRPFEHNRAFSGDDHEELERSLRVRIGEEDPVGQTILLGDVPLTERIAA